MKNRKLWLLNPDVVERYQNGETCNQIALAYGSRRNTIAAALRSVGVRVRHKGDVRYWTLEEERLAVNLRQQRKTYAQIAQITGRSLDSVQSKLRKIYRVPSPEAYMRSKRVEYEDVMSMMRSA